MKRLIAIVFIIPVLAGTLGAAEALVIETEGTVEIRESAGDEWIPLEENTVVPTGATISTGFNAGAVLEVGPTARLHVDALTRIKLEELIEQEGLVESDIQLSVGRVQGEVRGAEDTQTDFQVRSVNATASVRGTSFEFDGVNLRVSEGQVELANNFNQHTSIREGERSSTTGDGPPPSGDESREADSNVNIYTAGVDERTEGGITGRESDNATLRVELEIAQ